MWIPLASGRIIKIIDVTGGMANLDIDGDDDSDATDAAGYTGLGITDAERTHLGTNLYSTGQSLWRVQLSHFSPIDLNWQFGPPPPPPSPRPSPQCKECDPPQGGGDGDGDGDGDGEMGTATATVTVTVMTTTIHRKIRRVVRAARSSSARHKRSANPSA
jgi:hypothetical protein